MIDIHPFISVVVAPFPICLKKCFSFHIFGLANLDQDVIKEILKNILTLSVGFCDGPDFLGWPEPVFLPFEAPTDHPRENGWILGLEFFG